MCACSRVPRWGRIGEVNARPRVLRWRRIGELAAWTGVLTWGNIDAATCRVDVLPINKGETKQTDQYYIDWMVIYACA